MNLTDADVAVPAEGATPAKTLVGTAIFPPNASGEYLISARVTRGDDVLDGTLTLTVGEPGDPIGSIEVSVGKVGHSAAKNAKSDGDITAAYGAVIDKPDDYGDCVDSNGDMQGDQPDARCVAVTVTVQNSLGNAANSKDISGIHLFAPLADIYVAATPETNHATEADANGTISLIEPVDNANDGVGATVNFFIAKAAAGTTNVSAIILGAGNATSSVLTLTFTGSADSIALGDPSSPLSQNGRAAGEKADVADTDADESKSSGEATIEVTAADKSGNVATLTCTDRSDDPNTTGDDMDESDGDCSDTDTDGARPETEPLGVEVVDADDATVETIKATQSQKTDSKGNPVATAVVITLNATDASPGEYTVNVTLGESDPVATTVVVAGKVADVAIETSESNVAIGDIITVTATVTDEDGNLQPDAGAVTFQAVGALDLNALGVGATAGNVSVNLDDGVASARFVVVSGSGTATIIASIAGVDGVTSVSTDWLQSTRLWKRSALTA